MQTNEIISLLNKHNKVKPIFRGVYAKNMIPQLVNKPCAIVFNTAPIEKDGHWVGIYINDKGIGEYFDSMGMAPNIEFKNFLNRNCKEWFYNTKRLQDYITITCGYYVIMYLIARSKNITTQKYLNQFSVSDYLENDIKITRQINNLYGKHYKPIDIRFLHDMIIDEVACN